MKDNTLGKVAQAGIWGVVIGGAVGFALGMLLAPEPGKKLRRRLVYQMDHAADQVGTMVDQVLSPEAANEARRRGDALVADAREKAQRIREDIDVLLGEIRQRDPQPPSSPSTS